MLGYTSPLLYPLQLHQCPQSSFPGRLPCTQLTFLKISVTSSVCLPMSTIFGTTTGPFWRCFTVANTRATDHMFSDKLAFISYKVMSNLQVCMGNKTLIPVLGQGTAIITLNGKKNLVGNALHVPGLVVPLYSLCTHLTQCGCGFIGTNEYGMLVYFPHVVLSVDMLSDCHLSYKPNGSGAPLDSLHYVQPLCLPTLYPSELAASSNTASPLLALVQDDTSTVAPSAPLPPPTA